MGRVSLHIPLHTFLCMESHCQERIGCKQIEVGEIPLSLDLSSWHFVLCLGGPFDGTMGKSYSITRLVQYQLKLLFTEFSNILDAVSGCYFSLLVEL